MRNDEGNLRKVTDLAVYRRVIHVIEAHGYCSQKQLKDVLGMLFLRLGVNRGADRSRAYGSADP